MTPCRSCNWLPDINIAPGILRDLRIILGPKPRSIGHGLTEIICWWCQRAVAKRLGIIL